jgi:FkbM family methyltransferase
MKHLWNFLLSHPLLKGRPFYAFTRFTYWQVRSRISSMPVVFPWVGGSRLWLRRGWSGLTGNYYAGLSDFEEMAFLLHFLRPGELFVDVGANMGSYTILAGAVRRCRVVAYEPVHATYQRLEANVLLNQIEGSVVTRNAAVGATSGFLQMTSTLDVTNHVTANIGVGEPVFAVTLDDDLVETPILIKIDVEGYEFEVLRSASRHLADPRLRAIIIELNGAGSRYGHQDKTIHALLEAAGFSACIYEPISRTLSDARGGKTDNVLYCRDIASIESRLRSALPFEVAGRSI